MPAPPLPFLPAEQHGQLVIMALMVYAGEVQAGQRAVAPFRALATPLADLVKPMPYPAIYPPEDPDYHPAAVGHTMFIDQVDRQVAKTIVEYLQASDASVRVAQLRVLGGAMARVPAEATAFAHRGSAIMATVAGFYDGAADRPVRQAWVDQFAAALRQRDDGAYAGYQQALQPYRSTWVAGFEFPRRLLRSASAADSAATEVVRAALASHSRPRYQPGVRTRMRTRLLTVLPTRAADQIKRRLAGVATTPHPV